MRKGILAFLGLTQTERSRREGLSLRTRDRLAEVEADIRTAQSYTEWEFYRLGSLCAEKNVPRSTALVSLTEVLAQCEAIRAQVQRNRDHLETRGPSKRLVAQLDELKLMSFQLQSYAQKVSVVIEQDLLDYPQPEDDS